MQPVSGNQRPDLQTALMDMSLVFTCHGKCIFADPLQMSHACHHFWKCHKTPRFAHFWQGPQSPAPATRNDIWTSKSGPNPGVFHMLTSKCASCHNVHFFDISTSKSAPELRCFVHFDLEMCFAPQRRALFRHLNCQKWSGGEVLCTFWLRNVLRATTACTFSTSQLPKLVRTWSAFSFFTCKCASRHNGVHFFDISTAKSGLDMVCFAHFDFEMCFAPQRRAIFHLSSGQLAPRPPL